MKKLLRMFTSILGAICFLWSLWRCEHYISFEKFIGKAFWNRWYFSFAVLVSLKRLQVCCNKTLEVSILIENWQKYFRLKSPQISILSFYNMFLLCLKHLTWLNMLKSESLEHDRYATITIKLSFFYTDCYSFTVQFTCKLGKIKSSSDLF